jgi:hypothetical protein
MQNRVEALVASITPQRVEELAWLVESRQPAVNRGTAPLHELLEELTLDLPLSAAAQRSSVEMRLRQAIVQAVAQIEGMTFIEGDG